MTDINFELLEACKINSIESVKEILNNTSLTSDFRDETDGNTALHIACQEGFTEIVQHLISSSLFDINGVNKIGHTSLSLATKGDHSEIVDLLTSAGGIIKPLLKANRQVSLALLRAYQSELNYLTIEHQNSVGGVLFSSVFAVINHTVSAASKEAAVEAGVAVNSAENNNQLAKNHKQALITENFTAAGKFVDHPFHSSSTTTLLSGLFREAESLGVGEAVRADVNCIEADDSFTFRRDASQLSSSFSGGDRSTVAATDGTPSASTVRAFHPTDQGLMQFEKHAVTRMHIVRLLGDGVFPSKPEMTAVERGVKETELLHFSSLSASDLYRSNQMQDMYALLQEHTKPLPNFTKTVVKQNNGENGVLLKRRYFRTLSAFLFAQLLQKETPREPVSIKKYYTLTDDLLYCLHWAPPERRIRKEQWISPHNSNGNDSTGTNSAIAMNTVTLTPAGRAIVLIKQITCITSEVEGASKKKPKTPKRKDAPPEEVPVSDAWLSIYINDSLLGLRVIQPKVVNPVDAEEDLSTGSKKKKGGKVSKKSGSVANLGSPTNKLLPVTDTALDGVKRGSFFCHTEDDVRIISCAGPIVSPEKNKKPDQFGTVCFVVSFVSGMSVCVCSNGTYKMTPSFCNAYHPSSSHNNSTTPSNGTMSSTSTAQLSVAIDPLRFETSRCVGINGTVRRNLAVGPYAYEILSADGTRTLYRRSGKSGSKGEWTDFHVELLSAAPADWESVQLHFNGSVLFFSPAGAATGENMSDYRARATSCDSLDNQSVEADEQPSLEVEGSLLDAPSSPSGGTRPGTSNTTSSRVSARQNQYNGNGQIGTPHSKFVNIRDYHIDAETKSVVSTYTDGRLVVEQTDGLRRVIFSDGTTITTHQNGSVVFVERPDYPLIELDVEVDNMCRSHSRGIEVPINKGGERVRSRVALPDGTAVMIRYDTRITATTNGSIKLVRRDKTVLLVRDDGVVTYAPRTSWSAKDAAAFALEAIDCDPPKQQATSPKHGNSFGASSFHTQAMVGGGGSVTSKMSGSTKRVTVAGEQSSVASKVANLSINTSGKATKKGSKTSAAAGGTQSVTLAAPSSSSPKKEGSSVFVSTESQETKFTLSIADLTCKIQDYEHNCFTVSLLSNPLEPAILLSGEVEGLKPPAVSDNPMEPRVFIMNRQGEATEVVS